MRLVGVWGDSRDTPGSFGEEVERFRELFSRWLMMKKEGEEVGDRVS